MTAARTALQAYVDRLNAGDAAGVCALFAPDAVIEDPVGSEPKRGAAIAAWFADAVAFSARLEPAATIRGSHGNAAALAFEVAFTPADGTPLRIRSVDVCEVNADGLIVSLKAYWGPEDVAAG